MTCKDICKLVYSERREKNDTSLHLGAARKALMLSKIAIFRVAKTTTLKMPKSLTVSVIRAARPGGSEPPPSLGVRPKLAQKWSRESSAVL